jgi:hypothetical protein
MAVSTQGHAQVLEPLLDVMSIRWPMCPADAARHFLDPLEMLSFGCV